MKLMKFVATLLVSAYILDYFLRVPKHTGSLGVVLNVRDYLHLGSLLQRFLSHFDIISSNAGLTIIRQCVVPPLSTHSLYITFIFAIAERSISDHRETALDLMIVMAARAGIPWK